MAFLRLNERFDFAPCTSDGMRLDAWKVAIQGVEKNLVLPANEPYYIYYQKSQIGQYTIQKCNTVFVSVHNFYLEQLYYGGIFWFLLLCFVFIKVIIKTWRKTLGLGFLAFAIFLGVSPTYFIFNILLLSFLFLLYTDKVDIIRD